MHRRREGLEYWGGQGLEYWGGPRGGGAKFLAGT